MATMITALIIALIVPTHLPQSAQSGFARLWLETVSTRKSTALPTPETVQEMLEDISAMISLIVLATVLQYGNKIAVRMIFKMVTELSHMALISVESKAKSRNTR